MENVNNVCKPDSINRPIRIAVMILHNFQDTRTFVSFERLCTFMF